MGGFRRWRNFDVSVSKKVTGPVLGHRFRIGVSGFTCPCCWTIATSSGVIAELGGCPCPEGPADLVSELLSKNVRLEFACIAAFLRRTWIGLASARRWAKRGSSRTLHDAIVPECGLRLERSGGRKSARPGVATASGTACHLPAPAGS
jgi:hypothetical protein